MQTNVATVTAERNEYLCILQKRLAMTARCGSEPHNMVLIIIAYQLSTK